MSVEGVAVLAVFVQVALTIWAIVSLGQARIIELKKREIPLGDIAIQTDAYPEHIQLLGQNVKNQFELPVLFFTCVCLSIGLESMNWVIAIASFVFAISRIGHRYIHVGSNRLQSRFKVYAVGLAAVCLMWISLAYEMLLR